MPVKNFKLFNYTSLSGRIDEALEVIKIKLYQLLFRANTYLAPIINYITDKKFKMLHYLPWLDFVLRYSFILLVSFSITNTLILSLAPLPVLSELALFIFTCSACISAHAKLNRRLKLPKILGRLLYLCISSLVCIFFRNFDILFNLVSMYMLTPQSTYLLMGKKPLSPLITTPIIVGMIATGLLSLFHSIAFWPLLAGVTLITQLINEYFHIKKLAPGLSIKTHLKLIMGSRDTCLHPVNYKLLLTGDKPKEASLDKQDSSIQIETSNLFDDNTSPENKEEVFASISEALGKKARVSREDSKLKIKKKTRIDKKDLALIHPDRNRKHKKLYTELFALLSRQATEADTPMNSTSKLSSLALGEIKSLFETGYSIIAIEQKLSLETSTFFSLTAQYLIVYSIRATVKLTSGKQQIIDFLRPGLDLEREGSYYLHGPLLVGTRAENDVVNILRSELITLPEEVRAIC